MKLLKLTIKNFKGITFFEVCPEGGSMDIYGANATGKTSIFDAVMWLLFDKDSADRKTFEIKPRDLSGATLGPDTETEVTAVIAHDGDTVELRKAYKEKWTKKTGSTVKQFSGHDTVYRVDGLKIKAKQYEERVAGICGTDVFKLLTNPLHFNSIDWQDRRRILFALAGDLTDDEVIASSEELAPLRELRGKHPVTDYRTICAETRANLDHRLPTIPSRIAELQTQRPAVLVDIEAEKARAVALQAEHDALAADVQDPLAALRQDLAAKQVQLRGMEVDLRESDTRARQIQETRGNIDHWRNQRHVWHDQALASARKNVENTEGQLAALRVEYTAIRAEEWTGDGMCPTCRQQLPADKIEEAKAVFNREKSFRLTKNVEAGTAAKTDLDAYKADVVRFEDMVRDIDAKIAEAQEKLSGLEGTPPPQEPTAMVNLREEVAAIASKIAAGSADSKQDEVIAKRATIKGQIADCERNILRAEEWAKTQDRIKELEDSIKQTAADLEAMEYRVGLCDLFARRKAEMIEEKINGRFRHARFRLFKEQINGGIAETCETTYNGVPFPDLNTAAKINIGLDIINTLSGHYDFSAPIFVDNAESITDLWPTAAQVIRLVVSAADTTLRVEQAHDNREVA